MCLLMGTCSPGPGCVVLAFITDIFRRGSHVLRKIELDRSMLQSMLPTDLAAGDNERNQVLRE